MDVVPEACSNRSGAPNPEEVSYLQYLESYMLSVNAGVSLCRFSLMEHPLCMRAANDIFFDTYAAGLRERSGRWQSEATEG